MNHKYSLIISGVFLSIIFWFVESAAHFLFFSQGNFLDNLIFIDIHEFWMRFIVVVIIFSFSVLVNFLFIQQRRSKNQIQHLNQVLRSIRGVNSLITKEKDYNKLMQGICDSLVETRGYNNAWITNLNNGEIVLKAHTMQGSNISLLRKCLSEKPTIRCVSSALENSGVQLIENLKFCNCPLSQNHANDSAFSKQLEYKGKTYGTITVSIPRTYAHSLEEQKLFNALTSDISYALFNLELKKERQEAEEALKKEKLKFQKLIENMKEGLLLEDENGLITYVNPRTCEFLNFNEDELIGKHYTEIVPIEDRERVLTESKKRIKGINSSYEASLLTKSNKTLPVIISASPNFSSEGKFQGILSVFTDISERKKLEIKRKKFVEMTSHELRTPMTCIKGFIEVLERYSETITQEKKGFCLNIINKNIIRLERLIDDVSGISTIERGKFRLIKQEVDFFDFINYEARKYSFLLGDQFEFKPNLNDSRITLQMDKERISQVIDNIISNALKQTIPDNRSIFLKTEIKESKKKIQITISDNGIGIAPTNIKKIFEEFVAIETSYSTGGSGVGLYLCKIIIEEHNGKIWAESNGIGTGTSFTFELPIFS